MRLIDPSPSTDRQAISDFLSKALETGRKDRILRAINSIARARGMSALARDTGINRTVLYAALKDGANPTLETLLSIIEGLGLRLRAESNVSLEQLP